MHADRCCLAERLEIGRKINDWRGGTRYDDHNGHDKNKQNDNENCFAHTLF